MTFHSSDVGRVDYEVTDRKSTENQDDSEADFSIIVWQKCEKNKEMSRFWWERLEKSKQDFDRGDITLVETGGSYTGLGLLNHCKSCYVYIFFCVWQLITYTIF